jgi:hypothetical protein
MSSAEKHRKRSHRNHHKTVSYVGFERNAALKADDKHKKTLAQRLFNFIKFKGGK